MNDPYSNENYKRAEATAARIYRDEGVLCDINMGPLGWEIRRLAPKEGEFRGSGDTVKFDGEVQAVYTSAGWAPVEGSRRDLREAIWSLDNNAPADALAREANRRLMAAGN